TLCAGGHDPNCSRFALRSAIQKSALRRPEGGGYSAAMLDIRLIREKPDFVRERIATRGGEDAAKVDELFKVDAERRKAETELQQLQSERNRLSKEIGAKNLEAKRQKIWRPRFERSATRLSILSAVRRTST